MLSQLIQRASYQGRQALGLPPRNEAEELWRVRGLHRLRPLTPGAIRWRGQMLHYADGPALLDQLHDIFGSHGYDFHSTSESPRILDCGSHVGLAILRWRELYPHARITAFEADPAIAGYLRSNLAAFGDTQTVVHAAAAWIADTTLSFRTTGADSGHVASSGGLTVPALDLAVFCREPVDLLKLDIEGAEVQVLPHLLASGSLHQVRRIVVEWHQWTPEAPGVHSALANLAAAGFNYRIASAHCLSDRRSPDFPALPWPGNHVVFYAWRSA